MLTLTDGGTASATRQFSINVPPATFQSSCQGSGGTYGNRGTIAGFPVTDRCDWASGAARHLSGGDRRPLAVLPGLPRSKNTASKNNAPLETPPLAPSAAATFPDQQQQAGRAIRWPSTAQRGASGRRSVAPPFPPPSAQPDRLEQRGRPSPFSGASAQPARV